MAATSSSPPSDAPTIEVVKHALPELLRKFRPLLRPHRVRLIVGCILIAGAGGIYGFMPLFAKQLFDHALPEKNLHLALYIAGGFLTAHLVRMSMWNVAMNLIMHVQTHLTFALRAQGFGHLQRLSLRFHNKYPSGFLYESIFGSAINTIANAMQTICKQVSLYVTAILTSLIACLMLNVPMTLVVLAGSCSYVALARFASPRIYKRSLDTSEVQNRITDFIVDRLRGTKTIQALALEDRVQTDFEERLWPMQLTTLRAAREQHFYMQVSEYCGHLVSAAIMVTGAYFVIRADMTLGDLVAFIAYQSTFITIVQTLANIYGDFGNARAGMDRLFTVLGTASTVVDKPSATMPAVVKGDLEFRGMTFGYEPGTPILSELNLRVPAGQTVALVGRSGGGKTTIANLLLRFYDPDQGQLLLDGRDIRELPLRDYRSLYGVVLQDPYLFNESIATNLRYARPEATDEELRQVLEHARAWEFVQKFPKGIHHRVGESGASISGGQRQRLAIARCLLLRSRFVILDEPTSALDVESESHVQEAFNHLFAGRTVFVIAHRLSTIRRANRILVIDQGRVQQDGTFAELLAQEGPFRRLYDLATQIGIPTTAGRPGTGAGAEVGATKKEWF